GGVDSGRIATVQSQSNPNGLPRTMLAWLDNGTVRGGAISPRPGWLKLLSLVTSGLFQGGFLYNPVGADPYFIVSVSGTIYQVLVDSPNTVTNLSQKFNLFNPTGVPQAYFAQGQQFLVIQAGDYVTLPLFWDGTILRRSNGLSQGTSTSINYALQVTGAGGVPPAGSTVTVMLASPYPGSVNDILQWGGYGSFKVTSITGNAIVLTTLNTSLGGASVLPGVYNVGATAAAASTTYNVTTTNAPQITSQVGFAFDAVLTAPYAGAVGDNINFVSLGIFTVIGLSNANMTVTLSEISLLTSPGTLAAGPYTWIATPAATPPTPSTTRTITTTTPTPITQQVGFTFNLALNAGTPYTGAVGDTVVFSELGI